MLYVPMPVCMTDQWLLRHLANRPCCIRCCIPMVIHRSGALGHMGGIRLSIPPALFLPRGDVSGALGHAGVLMDDIVLRYSAGAPLGLGVQVTEPRGRVVHLYGGRGSLDIAPEPSVPPGPPLEIQPGNLP